MATPPTADSPTPERHRKPARADADPGHLLRKLTPREAQTLAHLAAGHDLPRTAATLGITPTTARSYLQRALRKLGTRTQAEALALLAATQHRPRDPDPTGLPAGLGPSGGAWPPPPGPLHTAPAPSPAAALHPMEGAARPRADLAPNGDAAGKRRRARAGKPAPGAADGTRGAALVGGTDHGTPADQPQPAAVTPPATAKSAAPRRAQRALTPGGRPGDADANPAPSAAPAQADGHHQPPDPSHPPTAPADPGGRGDAPRTPPTGQARVASAPTATASGDGRPTSAPAMSASRESGSTGTPTAGPAGHVPVGPDRERQASPEHEEHDPTAPARAPRPGRGPATPCGAPTATAAAGGGGGPEHTAGAADRDDTPHRPSSVPEPDDRQPQPAESVGHTPVGPDRPPHPAADGSGIPPRAPAAPEADAGHPRPARPEPPEERAPASPGRTALAAAAPGGGDDDLDAEPPVGSFEELYETAHTRLVQQVFLLTSCRHRAVHCVRRAFGEARRCWGAVAASGSPEGWVRVRACELALSPWHRGGPRRAHAWGLPHRRIKVRPADESQAVLPDHDRLTDRDRALLKALKRLSRPQRRALVLHDGLGLPAAAVAVEVESTRAAAEGRVWAARAALAAWVPELVGPDPAAPGFADGLCGLLHRAAVRGCPEPHRTPVPVLRARYRLRTASRTGAAALLTVVVGGATLATLAGVRPAELFRPTAPPAPALCLPVTWSEEGESGVPLLPDGAPNGIASIWCSPAPGLAAVLADPQPQAFARWELPPAARGAAPPPQGPVACRQWSPLPCTTGPRRH
ncbi:LuxR C-terminal-related transcriptional regulator [Kitasatospora sp. NPDC058444]|uniref:LuxR C-terminal-related transcriptional regulator n=1 Tax=Kitasatospora sp. NPDC058444 TaxID=3346504 RepID=UPI003669F9A1